MKFLALLASLFLGSFAQAQSSVNPAPFENLGCMDGGQSPQYYLREFLRAKIHFRMGGTGPSATIADDCEERLVRSIFDLAELGKISEYVQALKMLDRATKVPESAVALGFALFKLQNTWEQNAYMLDQYIENRDSRMWDRLRSIGFMSAANTMVALKIPKITSTSIFYQYFRNTIVYPGAVGFLGDRLKAKHPELNQLIIPPAPAEVITLAYPQGMQEIERIESLAIEREKLAIGASLGICTAPSFAIMGTLQKWASRAPGPKWFRAGLTVGLPTLASIGIGIFCTLKVGQTINDFMGQFQESDLRVEVEQSVQDFTKAPTLEKFRTLSNRAILLENKQNQNVYNESNRAAYEMRELQLGRKLKDLWKFFEESQVNLYSDGSLVKFADKDLDIAKYLAIYDLNRMQANPTATYEGEQGIKTLKSVVDQYFASSPGVLKAVKSYLANAKTINELNQALDLDQEQIENKLANENISNNPNRMLLQVAAHVRRSAKVQTSNAPFGLLKDYADKIFVERVKMLEYSLEANGSGKP